MAMLEALAIWAPGSAMGLRGVPPAPRPETGDAGLLVFRWAEGMLRVGWPPRVVKAALEASGWRSGRAGGVVEVAACGVPGARAADCETFVLAPPGDSS